MTKSWYQANIKYYKSNLWSIVMDSLNISRASGLKRKLEIDFAEEKKSITSLPSDSLDHIVNYLDFKALFNFEYVSKSCKELKNFESINFWRVLKVKDNLNFSWAMCQKEANPPKWEYRLSRGLCQYIFVDKYQDIPTPATVSLGFQLAEKIHLKYRDLLSHFPILEAYIGVDLNRFANFKPGTNQVSKKVIIEFNKMCLEGFSGEKFLRGLIASRESGYFLIDTMKIIEALFTDSINNGSACASLYALTLHTNLSATKERLAIKAAEHKDERALIKLFESDGNLPGKLFNMGHRFHSVCKHLGDISFNVKNYINAENYYDLALKADHAEDKFLLQNVGSLKLYLKKYTDADVLYTRALELFGESATSITLADAGLVKIQLKHYEVADVLLTKSLEISGESAPRQVILNAGSVKKQLKQYLEADVLYTKALNLLGQNAIPITLENAAQVKMQLKQYLEADDLFGKVLNLAGQNATPSQLAAAGQVKMILKQYSDADVLFTKALNLDGNRASPGFLVTAGEAKMRLNQYQDADVLFTKAFEFFGQSVPSFVLGYAGEIKVHLKQYPEADVFFTKALELLDQNASPALLISAVNVKILLEQYMDADVLYARILKLLGKNASGKLLTISGNVKLQLKQYQDADVLFTKALERFAHNPPAELLQKIAQVKLLLKDSV